MLSPPPMQLGEYAVDDGEGEDDFQEEDGGDVQELMKLKHRKVMIISSAIMQYLNTRMEFFLRQQASQVIQAGTIASKRDQVTT